MFGTIIEWLVSGPQSLAAKTMLATIVSTGTSVDLPSSPDSFGVASRFGDVGDKWIGGTLACQPDDRVSLDEHQCAHRKYPCGTILVIENARSGDRSWCEVVDRGPYGAHVFLDGEPVLTETGEKAWYVKNTRDEDPPEELCPMGGCKGRWRGILDTSPAVNDDLNHNGLEKVRVYRIRRVRSYLKSVFRRDERDANESRT